MTTITIDVTNHASEYVNDLYGARYTINDLCESIMDTCKGSLNDPEVAVINNRAKNLHAANWDEIRAIDAALAALRVSYYSEGVESDGIPTSINRIRVFINAYEYKPDHSTEVFRAVLSAFGITYEYHSPADTTIRYTFNSAVGR